MPHRWKAAVIRWNTSGAVIASRAAMLQAGTQDVTVPVRLGFLSTRDVRGRCDSAPGRAQTSSSLEQAEAVARRTGSARPPAERLALRRLCQRRALNGW